MSWWTSCIVYHCASFLKCNGPACFQKCLHLDCPFAIKQKAMRCRALSNITTTRCSSHLKRWWLANSDRHLWNCEKEMDCKVKVVWLEREIRNHGSATIPSIIRDQVSIFPKKVFWHVWFPSGLGFHSFFQINQYHEIILVVVVLGNVWIVLYSVVATNTSW